MRLPRSTALAAALGWTAACAVLSRSANAFGRSAGFPAESLLRNTPTPASRSARGPAVLSGLTLPPAPLGTQDWQTVQLRVREALARLQRAGGNYVESVLALEQWLATQACVESARAPRGSAEGVAAALLLTTDPPRVPIEVVFRTRREGPVPYRLLLDLGTDRGLHFVSLERRSP